MSAYGIASLCFVCFFLGFIIAAILAVPRAPHYMKSADEYLRESLKPFKYLFRRDIKTMQELYDVTQKLVDTIEGKKQHETLQ